MALKKKRLKGQLELKSCSNSSIEISPPPLYNVAISLSNSVLCLNLKFVIFPNLEMDDGKSLSSLLEISNSSKFTKLPILSGKFSIILLLTINFFKFTKLPILSGKILRWL